MTEKKGKLPLHVCVRRRDLKTLTRLLDNGWPVDGRDWLGQTPLILAACFGHTNIVKVLISHGADVDGKEVWGQTSLHKSADSGHKETITLLILHRADVNVKDSNGWTPLHHSVRRGKKGTVKLLIQLGADIDPLNNDGYTPLMMAKYHGHRDIVKILRQAKPEQTGDGGELEFLGISFCYSLSTRKLSIQSSDGGGHITKVKYEDKEVSSHVTGAVSASKNGGERDLDKVEFNPQKGSQCQKKQEPVTKCGFLHPHKGDDHEKEDEDEFMYRTGEVREMGGEGKKRPTLDVDMTGKSASGLLLSTSSLTTPTNTNATATVTELRRRLESQAGYMEKMVQSCVAGGGVCQDQSSDLVPLHHGGLHVPVNFNFIMQPKHVEVWSARQMNVEKAEVERAEMMPVNSTCNFNYAAQKLSDDDDNGDSNDDDNSEDDKEIHIEDGDD